ncbi:TetR family transcriptional regulator [Microterricola gilva]|uniref:TetR family transcriptional regulator n=1 Tax=Microterricola gilva TaxID=393267 RepID=A0A4Q8APN8_9MICO|nr:TetR/AcrR family transcriptional regulator [Microterricola gilva]RZU66141.1 TetR family transcriptional regulator [Microterricola gilva]
MARRLSPEARRAEIIEVAHALILEKGYRDLSLREVARRCEMSAPGLMHYFPDMHTLLEAVLAHRDEIDLAAIQDGTSPSPQFTDFIDAATRYYSDRAEEMSRFDALEVEALDPQHPAHDWFATRNERNLELVRPAVEREFENPDRVIQLLRYLIDGIRLSWMRNPENRDFESGLRALQDLLVILPRTADENGRAAG